MTPNEQKAPTAKGMVPVTDALLDQMVQAIVAEVDPEQVILFGSRARGDAREDSDVDLVVVEAEPFGPKTKSPFRNWSGSTMHWWNFPSPPTSSSIPMTTSTTGATHSTTFWRERCGKGRCSMSDVKCARMLLDAAERDVAHSSGTCASSDDCLR